MANTSMVKPGREGYKILFDTNTVILNYKFAAAAAKYGTKENTLLKLRFFPLGSSHGLRCVFAGTGVKTVSPNENHSWWESEPHNTPIGETRNYYPVYSPYLRNQ